jgi:NAD(P)-dependent dehydrogenase (short-subunit alcohol dehydrogenase family)
VYSFRGGYCNVPCCSGRVLTLSSSVHNVAKSFDFEDINAERGHYEMFHNYGLSKLANILLTKELTRR